MKIFASQVYTKYNVRILVFRFLDLVLPLEARNLRTAVSLTPWKPTAFESSDYNLKFETSSKANCSLVLRAQNGGGDLVLESPSKAFIPTPTDPG